MARAPYQSDNKRGRGCDNRLRSRVNQTQPTSQTAKRMPNRPFEEFVERSAVRKASSAHTDVLLQCQVLHLVFDPGTTHHRLKSHRYRGTTRHRRRTFKISKRRPTTGRINFYRCSWIPPRLIHPLNYLRSDFNYFFII